jgi:hypothetical protein
MSAPLWVERLTVGFNWAAAHAPMSQHHAHPYIADHGVERYQRFINVELARARSPSSRTDSDKLPVISMHDVQSPLSRSLTPAIGHPVWLLRRRRPALARTAGRGATTGRSPRAPSCPLREGQGCRNAIFGCAWLRIRNSCCTVCRISCAVGGVASMRFSPSCARRYADHQAQRTGGRVMDVR